MSNFLTDMTFGLEFALMSSEETRKGIGNK